jgi:class 3 adenylate cyclase
MFRDHDGKPLSIATFLFTDVEGSTRLLERHPAAYRKAIAKHHLLLREAIEQRRGRVFETIGDAVYAIFELATDAAAAAVNGQSALQDAEWGETGALKVHMGLHTGEVERQGSHYFGVSLNRCARLMSTAHGGQIVVSAATASLLCDVLETDHELCDLGEHRLKDLERPERIFQLNAPDLKTDFPPLRTVQERCHNLPLQLTAFTGRRKETALACGLLSQPQTRRVSELRQGLLWQASA